MSTVRLLFFDGAIVQHARPAFRRLLIRNPGGTQRRSATVAASRGTSEKAWRR
jgi:hypothetical protein